MADSKTIRAVKKVIEDEKLPNNKGIHIAVSKRKNFTQSWCPSCLSDDIMYDEETKELECSECGHTVVLKDNYGMDELIKHTCDLLPDLAKDAFMYSQTASLSEKDKRSKEIVLETCHQVSLDMKGEFIKKVAEMCAKLFIIWGWPLTAGTFKESLAQMQSEYISKLGFSERMAASTLDKFFGNKLSQGFSGFIGYTMSRGMKKLNQNLILNCSKGDMENMKLDDFMSEADLDEESVKMFFDISFMEGIEKALDKMWDLTAKELEELKKQMVLNGEVDIFAGVDDEKKKEIEAFISKQENFEKKEIVINQVTDKKEEKKEEKEEEPKKDFNPSHLDLD